MKFFKLLINKIVSIFSGNNTIFYINGPQKLPEPLSREEESEILQSYDGSDGNIRNILITHNLRLVVYIAKRFDTGASNIGADMAGGHLRESYG